jgi:hypothetical protein
MYSHEGHKYDVCAEGERRDRCVSMRAVMEEESPSKGWIQRFEMKVSEHGPLEGRTFAVKDMFSIKGHTNVRRLPLYFCV